MERFAHLSLLALALLTAFVLGAVWNMPGELAVEIRPAPEVIYSGKIIDRPAKPGEEIWL